MRSAGNEISKSVNLKCPTKSFGKYIRDGSDVVTAVEILHGLYRRVQDLQEKSFAGSVFANNQVDSGRVLKIQRGEHAEIFKVN